MRGAVFKGSSIPTNFKLDPLPGCSTGRPPVRSAIRPKATRFIDGLNGLGREGGKQSFFHARYQMLEAGVRLIRQCGATPKRAGPSSLRLRAILRPIHQPNARYYRPPTSALDAGGAELYHDAAAFVTILTARHPYTYAYFLRRMVPDTLPHPVSMKVLRCESVSESGHSVLFYVRRNSGSGNCDNVAAADGPGKRDRGQPTGTVASDLHYCLCGCVTRLLSPPSGRIRHHRQIVLLAPWEKITLNVRG